MHKGSNLVRQFSTCCRTPVANNVSGLPHIGLHAKNFRSEEDFRFLGKPSARMMTRYALMEPPRSPTPKRDYSFSMLCLVCRFICCTSCYESSSKPDPMPVKPNMLRISSKLSLLERRSSIPASGKSTINSQDTRGSFVIDNSSHKVLSKSPLQRGSFRSSIPSTIGSSTPTNIPISTAQPHITPTRVKHNMCQQIDPMIGPLIYDCGSWRENGVPTDIAREIERVCIPNGLQYRSDH